MKNSFTTKTFAQNVFDYNKMRKYLPCATYKTIVAAREQGIKPSQKHAEIFAAALKKWALSKGVTRYTHWFQPLNNFTAEKRDSLSSIDKEGNAIIKFGGKQLQQGEGDASSLPNGGMRETFEARGITEWDYTAFPFIRGDCLRIPTTFCGAGGETLDKKTPLLNSCIALNKQALRLLSALGMPAKQVKSVVGAEQEYFLIDKTQFDKRKDLVYTGRTLFGKMAPKGQEFDDHYFRPPNEKVTEYMRQVDIELWKLGILVKTEHNEVAPCQYELVPCYTAVNYACDQNQLIMETLNNVATKQGLACLLHEKPFDKINGSGKHNNWSIITDEDCNLLEAGGTPAQNARFLLILSAIIQAVDNYNTLLESSAASANNDLRLGGYEAPPTVLTMFLGDTLLEAMHNAAADGWVFGKDKLPLDIYSADRNRTSPLAFSGNKFEFRMVGSSASIADVNTTLNTIVAESFRIYADRLEKSADVWTECKQIVAETLLQHGRVIYNGNGYSAEWQNEAKQRGLQAVSSKDLTCHMTSDKVVELFERHNILTKRELTARKEIKLQTYCNTVKLEAIVAYEIYQRQIYPAIEAYNLTLTQLAANKQSLDIDNSLECGKITAIDKTIGACNAQQKKIRALVNSLDKLPLERRAETCGGELRANLAELRRLVNELEQVCPKNSWPLPTYGQLLFGEK